MRTLIISCFTALALSLSGCFTMDGFLFNTQAVSSYTLSDSVIPVSAREFVTLTSGTQATGGQFKIYGFFVKSPLATPNTPTILYNHGNFKNIQEYWDRMELFYKAGFNTFIYDYRGFGMSEGKSSQEGLEQDAEAALAYTLSRPDVVRSNVIVYGYSLGGVPSVYLCSKYASSSVFTPRALITEAIFASATSLVQSGSLVNVPGSFLMKDEFYNADRIKQVRCPLLLMHGTADTFIDMSRHGEQIFANANEPKQFLRVQNAGHSTIPYTMGVDVYMRTLRQFATTLR